MTASDLSGWQAFEVAPGPSASNRKRIIYVSRGKTYRSMWEVAEEMGLSAQEEPSSEEDDDDDDDDDEESLRKRTESSIHSRLLPDISDD